MKQNISGMLYIISFFHKFPAAMRRRPHVFVLDLVQIIATPRPEAPGPGMSYLNPALCFWQCKALEIEHTHQGCFGSH